MTAHPKKRRLTTLTKPSKSRAPARPVLPRRKVVVEVPFSAREVRSGFGLSREKFARIAGASVRALANWESGELAPNEAARLKLVELDRLRRALEGVLESGAIPAWIDQPNAAFDGLKPLEVLERGEVDRLWRMVFLLESGSAS
ncbi:MAG: helix-turn-helix domain-containing protein [Planctomycetota bacterium]